MSESQPKTLRAECAEAFAETGEDHQEISKLFASVHKSLQFHKHYVEDSQTWLNYLGGVRIYLYFGHILEISILNENSDDLQASYYYVVFNFPEKIHLYEVIEIPKKLVPKFTAQPIDEWNDTVNLREIHIRVCRVLDKFCSEFIRKQKFKIREFSTRAIEPVFSASEMVSNEFEISRKRQKIMKDFQIGVDPVYDHLCELLKTVEDKPNASSRIFAFIHDTLVTVCACKTVFKSDEWPGGPNYNGSVCEFLFPETEGHELHAFYLSILTNESEFYLCLRFSANTSKKCIKKIVKYLVPTFEPSDIDKDYERVHNLRVWLLSIVHHFVEKVIDESYQSTSSDSGDESETSY